MQKSTTDHHYVNNREFYEAIVKHYAEKKKAEDEGREPPRIPDYIGECIWKIANRYTYHRWFINYSTHYKEEMVSDALEYSIKYFYNFDPDKTANPFAYFTRICHNAFRRRLQKEERSRYTMYKNAEKFIHDNDMEPAKVSLTNQGIYDNINEFIQRYEEKEERRKEEKKLKAKEKELNNDIE